MFSAIKGVIPVLPLLLMALSPAENRQNDENYYNKLEYLKDSAPPQTVKMIKIDNVAKGKSIALEGVLITYKNRYAGSVFLAGDFSGWKLDAMDRSRYGVWYYLIDGARLEKDSRYKLFVDGIWTEDPMNPVKMDDGRGSYVSIAGSIPEDSGKYLSFRFLDNNNVEFRLFKPGARLVSLAGDFNNWNPDSDLLEKDRKGIWRLEKRLFSGTYRYMYVIDGEWTYDPHNDETASDDTGAICSLISIR